MGQEGEMGSPTHPVISPHPGERISKKKPGTLDPRAQSSEALGDSYPEMGHGSLAQFPVLLAYLGPQGGYSLASSGQAVYV